MTRTAGDSRLRTGTADRAGHSAAASEAASTVCGSGTRIGVSPPGSACAFSRLPVWGLRAPKMLISESSHGVLGHWLALEIIRTWIKRAAITETRAVMGRNQ